MKRRLSLLQVLLPLLTACSQPLHPHKANRTLMETSLAASITLRQQNGWQSELIMENRSDCPVDVTSPGDFPPPSGWEYSREAYQVAALQSFHILKMTLIN